MTGAGCKTLFHQEPRQFDFFARKRLKPILPALDERAAERFWSKVHIGDAKTIQSFEDA